MSFLSHNLNSMYDNSRLQIDCNLSCFIGRCRVSFCDGYDVALHANDATRSWLTLFSLAASTLQRGKEEEGKKREKKKRGKKEKRRKIEVGNSDSVECAF